MHFQVTFCEGQDKFSVNRASTGSCDSVKQLARRKQQKFSTAWNSLKQLASKFKGETKLVETRFKTALRCDFELSRFFSAFLRNVFLCQDRVHGDVPPHFLQACYLLWGRL